MRQQQPRQPQQPFQDARKAFNLLYFLATAHATCLWPFMRRSFGIWAFGANALVGFAMIVMYLSATQSPAMLVFFWVWLALVAFHRAMAARRDRAGGLVVHSHYGGDSWLPLKLPFIRTHEEARRFEPLLCLFVGALLLPLDQGLGGFVMLGCLSLAISTGVNAEANRVRVQRMKDAFVEGQSVASGVRGGR